MEKSGPVPLLGQAWILCGFDVDSDPDAEEPGLFAADGETPLLLVPPNCEGNDLELAYGWAIAKLYLKRYGLLNLVRGIRAWDDIVADLGSGRDMAAD
jgi:hypothetical protein